MISAFDEMITVLSILLAVAVVCITITRCLQLRLRKCLRLSYPHLWNELDTPSRYYDDWGAFSPDAAEKFAFGLAHSEKCDEHVRTLASTFRRWVWIRSVALSGLLAVGTVYTWMKLL